MWKNLFESLLDLENLERSGESFLERILSEVCVCVCLGSAESKGERGREERVIDEMVHGDMGYMHGKPPCKNEGASISQPFLSFGLGPRITEK